MKWDLVKLEEYHAVYRSVFADDDSFNEPLVLEIEQDLGTGIASLNLFWDGNAEMDIKKSRDIDYLKELALMSCGAYVQSIAEKHEDKREDGVEV